MAPKNYSVKSLTKADEAEVAQLLKDNPLWKRKHARERVAMRKFYRLIHERANSRYRAEGRAQ